MTWNDKVVWTEGMFLRPQHFQQQDRYVEALVRNRSRYQRPYDWGFAELSLDTESLAIGKVALAKAQGVLPDGTPFNIPEVDEPPTPLEIEADTRDTRVLLALPLRRLGMPEFGRSVNGDTNPRYRAEVYETRDANIDSSNDTVPLEIGKRSFRLIIESEEHSAYASIGVVRVHEQLPDRSVVIDESYFPPCLHCATVPPLYAYVTEILGLLHQRGDALVDRLAGTGAARAGLDVAQFLRLNVINRFEPLFAHLGNINRLHPEHLYEVALQLAGELASFNTRTRRRPETFPAYNHDDLQNTFAPLMAELRRTLSLVEEQVAIQIPLEEHKFGIRVGTISDREKNLLDKASFVLAVQADVAEDLLRNRFPAQVKIGPVERIAQLVNHHLPGITVNALPVAPREIPFSAGSVYFKLDRSGEFWKQMANSGGFAFHVSGEFPGIDMAFWAIKE